MRASPDNAEERLPQKTSLQKHQLNLGSPGMISGVVKGMADSNVRELKAKKKKFISFRAGGTDQRLSLLGAFPGDLGLAPSSYMVAHKKL